MMAHMMMALFPQGGNGGHMPFRTGASGPLMAAKGQGEGGRGRRFGAALKRSEMAALSRSERRAGGETKKGMLV